MMLWNLRYKAVFSVTEIKITVDYTHTHIYICLNLWAADSFCLGGERKKHPQSGELFVVDF